MSIVQGYWECPHCGEVDARNVTNDERHDRCDFKVKWIEASPISQEDDHLWSQLFRDFESIIYAVNAELLTEARGIEKLKQHYTITRKTDKA